jgi:peptide-methionine (S)-S-oxide reductase
MNSKTANNSTAGAAIATLGGGCFWCTEAVFQELEGVEHVESGYAGGDVPDPTYQAVCSGGTGHAEVVRVHFDPSLISYRDILEVFFLTHDPTTPNQQGADVGTQYRSAIFSHSPEQREIAEELITELENNGVFDRPIVTEVTDLDTFYPAEEYHQDFYRRNPNQGYCMVVINPKLAKLRKAFADKLKQEA